MTEVMESADRKDDDEKHFAKRLQKAVALLLVRIALALLII
jgi:hypothetical protein